MPAKAKLLSIALIGASALSATAGWCAAAQSDGIWHTKGQTVVDGGGHPVQIRGVNLGNWLLWEGWMFDAGEETGTETTMLNRIANAESRDRAVRFLDRDQNLYVTEADIAAMKKAGFNLIRVPVNWKSLVHDKDCLACDGQGLAHLDRLIGWAQRYGLHVIIDMHAVPGGQSSFLTSDPPPGGAQYWSNADDQKRLVNLWHMVARHYARSDTVAGYDLINEPKAPSGAALLAAYRNLIASIRSVDPDHIIWLEGDLFAIDLKVFTKPLGRNIGYSSHVYILGPRDPRKRELTAATEAAHRLNAPVWIGEFGQSSYADTRSTVQMMKAADGVVGWAYWTWKRAAGSTPTLCALNLPKAWTDVSPWIGGTPNIPEPKPAEVTKGANAFLNFIEHERCTPDPEMVRMLKP